MTPTPDQNKPKSAFSTGAYQDQQKQAQPAQQPPAPAGRTYYGEQSPAGKGAPQGNSIAGTSGSSGGGQASYLGSQAGQAKGQPQGNSVAATSSTSGGSTYQPPQPPAQAAAKNQGAAIGGGSQWAPADFSFGTSNAVKSPASAGDSSGFGQSGPTPGGAVQASGIGQQWAPATFPGQGNAEGPTPGGAVKASGLLDSPATGGQQQWAPADFSFAQQGQPSQPPASNYMGDANPYDSPYMGGATPDSVGSGAISNLEGSQDVPPPEEMSVPGQSHGRSKGRQYYGEGGGRMT